jgi:putative oxidoreductase
MTDNSTARANRSYVWQITIFSIVYAVLVIGLSLWPGRFALSGPLLYLVAALPVLPIIGMIAAMMRLPAQSDEYVRDLMLRRYVVAIGMTLAMCTLWGFWEMFAHAPHIPIWIVFPLFCLNFGFACLLIPSARAE